MDVAQLFTPLIQANFYRKKGYIPFQGWPFFSTLVEAIMTRNDRPSLRHWKAFERPSIVQQAILLMHTGRPSPLVIDGDIDMSKSGLGLQETLESVVLDLGMLLFESLSAFVQIEYLEFRCTKDVDPPYIDYAFTPFIPRIGTILVPMASHLPDTSDDDSRIAWYQRIDRHVLLKHSPWKFDKLYCLAAFTTLLAMDPLDPGICAVNNGEGLGVLGKLWDKLSSKAGELQQYVPPIKARYVGPCLGIVYDYSKETPFFFATSIPPLVGP